MLSACLCLAISGCATAGSILTSGARQPSPYGPEDYNPGAPAIHIPRLSAALQTAPARTCGDYQIVVLDKYNAHDGAVAEALTAEVTGSGLTFSLRHPVASATFYVRYDGAQQHALSLKAGNRSGIGMALEVEPGLVAVGAAAFGDGMLSTEEPIAELTFADGPSATVRVTSISQNILNTIKADNLTPIDNVNESASLHWLEYNTGDCDVNGEVNIADITPIGQKYNISFDETHPDYATLEVIDADYNGEIFIADLTPIGQNYQSVITGYDVYRTPLATPDEVPLVTDTGRWTKVENAVNPAGPSAPRVFNNQKVRVPYTFTDICGEGDFGWYVQPVGTTLDGKDTTGPLGEVVTLHVSSSGPPPAGLSFEIQLPATDVVAVDDEFYLAVKVTDATDLFSANVRFEYDSSLVEYVEGVSAYAGHDNMLDPPLFVDADNVDPAEAPYVLLGFNATQTQGTPVVNGDGYLAYIKFRALATGANTSAFRFPQTTNFIYMWGEQYGVPTSTPALGSPQNLEVQ